HFHAALVQKRMTHGVHPRTYVYAPLDADLVAHLERVAAFNARPDDPTHWELDIRTGANYLERFAREQPGNTVVLSGKNRPKIDLMQLAVRNNLHVLADKPWVIESSDFPKLERLLAEADTREVLVWDIMTERHEAATRLQREFVRDPDIFGGWQAGSASSPGFALESVHHLKKSVAGRPVLRPWWWFDPAVSGESMADVGTHLADLALWFIARDEAVDFRRDVTVLDADRWPCVLSADQFRDLTGLAAYPPELAPRVVGGQLYYAGNNTVTFALCGVYVKLTTRWACEEGGGLATHEAIARGKNATVAVQQEPGQQPTLTLTATDPRNHAKLVKAIQTKYRDIAGDYPGIIIQDRQKDVRLDVPDELRTGHESHFAEVLDEFARYFQTPRAVPPWERPNALAKYFITTKAVELARLKRPTV
ncbi:MAG TPA: putative oxidoreductase C-terminal domain-containing protein, partial [Gemmataceae bacterium]|nr:putative oxidoreductase C-terminal domain-containing protein [Gemmataceae bacterium]